MQSGAGGILKLKDDSLVLIDPKNCPFGLLVAMVSERLMETDQRICMIEEEEILNQFNEVQRSAVAFFLRTVVRTYPRTEISLTESEKQTLTHARLFAMLLFALDVLAVDRSEIELPLIIGLEYKNSFDHNEHVKELSNFYDILRIPYIPKRLAYRAQHAVYSRATPLYWFPTDDDKVGIHVLNAVTDHVKSQFPHAPIGGIFLCGKTLDIFPTVFNTAYDPKLMAACKSISRSDSWTIDVRDQKRLHMYMSSDLDPKFGPDDAKSLPTIRVWLGYNGGIGKCIWKPDPSGDPLEYTNVTQDVVFEGTDDKEARSRVLRFVTAMDNTFMQGRLTAEFICDMLTAAVDESALFPAYD